MASIVNDPGGRRRIQFVAPDESRKTIRLGKIDRKGAESIARHVEALLSAKIGGQPVPRDTAVWLTEIGASLRNKLATVGLVEALKRSALGEFLAEFIANRKPTAAPNTITNLEQAKRRLVEYFGEDRAMAAITPADAEAWAAALAEKYSPATAGRTIKRARQFFKSALRNKLISENVFTEVKANGQPNKERQFHVDHAVILRVIDAAPDAEWRLLIALSRFGGLRCPSEHLALRWQDVDWDRNRFCVNSPKTGERWIPIFPELRPYLEECFELAKEGAVHVINRYRNSNANLRTTFTKIIKRAGEKPWPKLFHNLRASRETELAAEYPIHVVCEWIGNSAAIAAKHYLTVREEDFDRATKGGAKSGAPEAQNRAQQATAGKGRISHSRPEDLTESDFTRFSATLCDTTQHCLVPPRGLEPLPGSNYPSVTGGER
jgi:integrase